MMIVFYIVSGDLSVLSNMGLGIVPLLSLLSLAGLSQRPADEGDKILTPKPPRPVSPDAIAGQPSRVGPAPQRGLAYFEQARCLFNI
jgi:hypothetical protein